MRVLGSTLQQVFWAGPVGMQSPCCLHDAHGPSMAALGSAEEPRGCLVLSLFFLLLFLSLLRLWVLLPASPTHKQWVYVGVSCLQGFMAADAHAGAGWARHHSFGAVSEDLVLNLLPGGLISPPMLGSSALLLVLLVLFCFSPCAVQKPGSFGIGVHPKLGCWAQGYHCSLNTGSVALGSNEAAWAVDLIAPSFCS